MSLLVPVLFTELILPGMEKTSLPDSSARRAVIIAPLLMGASTTSTPNERPLMILFLRGKFCGLGGLFGGSSDTTSPRLYYLII